VNGLAFSLLSRSTRKESDQFNDWMGKDGDWDYSKRKMIEGERIMNGRSLNVVKEECRGKYL
jgi:hypothetical protein